MRDDWRLRIDFPDPHGFVERLRHTEARELAADLRGHRLAVTRDDDTVFVYAPNRIQAEQAQALVEQEVGADGVVTLEQWLPDEERWSDEPPGETLEEDLLERGFAPWEVHVETGSREEADRLEKELREEGYSVTRAFDIVIAGTDSQEAAVELARRVHGEVEAGGELVYEAQSHNPFTFVGALFGGLGE